MQVRSGISTSKISVTYLQDVLVCRSFVVKTVGPEALAISTKRLKTTHNPETGLLNVKLQLLRVDKIFDVN